MPADHRRTRPLLACALALLALGGCAQPPDDGTRSLPRLALGRPPVDPLAERSDALRLISRSLWGVTTADAFPAAEPELRGSAVAVTQETLAFACDAAGAGGEIGLVRRSSRRTARVLGPTADRRICLARVAEAGLRPIGFYRTPDDLRLGEPVLAVTSLTSRRHRLAEGRLVGQGGEGDPFLETTVSALGPTASAALFDGFGNLIGFGSSGAIEDAYLLAAPMRPEAALHLARARLADAPKLLATLPPDPATAPAPAPTILADPGGGGVDEGSAGSTAAGAGESGPPRIDPMPGPWLGGTEGQGQPAEDQS